MRIDQKVEIWKKIGYYLLRILGVVTLVSLVGINLGILIDSSLNDIINLLLFRKPQLTILYFVNLLYMISTVLMIFKKKYLIFWGIMLILFPLTLSNCVASFY